ncbi:uncharacterized protein FIESC28_05401 [Fusarium coffeatum]|uniref:Enoyl reductase (ER) domain-containing protein n=1 Tax=Fusarium coffeatum TaxID=231269 RepID=A0A366RTJ5_9HYPO|nr:uncharacterized protein FIESC28_05401 [Fusarium coffeatum]RBR20122.1 hypothetical protein FIESC28_05401 [Fusarium coffeatum]
MTTATGIVNVAPGRAEIKQIPVPELEPGFIRVKPTAWALNPDDVYHLDLEEEGEICAGLPVGSDYAGTVVEVGPGIARDFKIGDRVAGVISGQNILRRQDGAFADLIHVKGDIQMKIPENLSDVDAATQGIALITMGVGLYQTLKIPLPDARPEQPYYVFIYGGSTAMGISAVQFAKLSGATVITTSSPSNAEYVKSLGADHVLDYKSTTLADDILRLADGPVKFVFDTYPSKSSTALAASIMHKSAEARYVALVPGFEDDVQRLNPHVVARSILAYSAFGEPWMYEKKFFDAVPEDFEFQKDFVKMAEKYFADGSVKPPRVYLNRGASGLPGILCGLEELREGRVSGGKLVYTREREAA